MSTYHLHARRITGPLARPERDETRVDEGDDLAALDDRARELCAQGFTAWIYDHGRPAALTGASDYRVVGHHPPGSARPLTAVRPIRRNDPPEPVRSDKPLWSARS